MGGVVKWVLGSLAKRFGLVGGVLGVGMGATALTSEEFRDAALSKAGDLISEGYKKLMENGMEGLLSAVNWGTGFGVLGSIFLNRMIGGNMLSSLIMGVIAAPLGTAIYNHGLLSVFKGVAEQGLNLEPEANLTQNVIPEEYTFEGA